MRDQMHVVVGVDGSAHALAACQDGAHLARASGARLTLVHVAVPAWPRSSLDRGPRAAPRAEVAARLAGQRFLDEATHAAHAAGGVTPCSTELLFGDPPAAICDYATRAGADLVVLGSRGVSRLERVLFGSVSAAVAAQAPCSVYIVRERSIFGLAKTDLPKTQG